MIFEVESTPKSPPAFQPADPLPPELAELVGMHVTLLLRNTPAVVKSFHQRKDGLYLWCVADNGHGRQTGWVHIDRVGPPLEPDSSRNSD